MNEQIYIGIDPGASGGMCSMHADGGIIWTAPWEGENEAQEFLQACKADGDHVDAAIEKVGGFIKGNPAPGSAMFNFGESYGWWRGLLTGLQIPYCQVAPQKWQAGLMVPKKVERTVRKRFLCDVARQRFPSVKMTMKTCDAVLIADWLRRNSLISQRVFGETA